MYNFSLLYEYIFSITYETHVFIDAYKTQLWRVFESFQNYICLWKNRSPVAT
jgi:hypothetical protein